MGQPLDRYRSMRRFGETPEPSGAEPTREAEGLRFVVQEHHARRLHWDFRLEREGVLVSWALARGVPPDPKVNHLAVPTEDHPMSYVDFEGEIPEGNYGAGRVTVWDSGTYGAEKWEAGEVIVNLHGRRVQGRHVLFRTGERQWMIHRMDPPQDAARQPLPRGLQPMRAMPGPIPSGPGWSFEWTWPGLRVLALVEGGRVELVSADGTDVTDTFGEVRRLGRALGSRPAVLDGVLVTLDDAGRPDTGGLERRLGGAKAPAAVLMIFDVVHLDARDLLEQPWARRREALEGLRLGGPAWQVPPVHGQDGQALLAAARAQGLPGITAKALDSTYVRGEANGRWVSVTA